MVDQHAFIRQMKEYAEKNNVPIMMDDGIDFFDHLYFKTSCH